MGNYYLINLIIGAFVLCSRKKGAISKGGLFLILDWKLTQ